MFRLSMWVATLVLAASSPAFIGKREIHFRDKTGHYYVWITDEMKWNAANEFAKRYSVTFKGVKLDTWHLATITDAEENAYIFDVVLERGRSTETRSPSFLGGIKKDGSVANFTWVTGERFLYRNFAPGQPDFARENVLEMGGIWGPQWNDQDGPGSDGEPEQSFILEHDPVCVPSDKDPL
jgi:hypothetical protein